MILANKLIQLLSFRKRRIDTRIKDIDSASSNADMVHLIKFYDANLSRITSYKELRSLYMKLDDLGRDPDDFTRINMFST